MYDFGTGLPRSVIAVSRFTIATSAWASSGAIGLNIPAGFESSCDRMPPSKCTSPPKAKVTACPFPRRDAVVVVVSWDAGREDLEAGPAGSTAGLPVLCDSVTAAMTIAVIATPSPTTMAITTRRTDDQRTRRTPTYDGTAMSRLRISPRAYRQVTLAAAILLAAIIVTGAAVRLTGSGLGCPDWPNCTNGHLTAGASDDVHAKIEFANRMVTGLVSIGVIVAVLGSLVRTPRRKDLVWLSLGLVIGVIAQALLGALVVEELLSPPFVMGHFLLSAVLLADAIVLYHRAGIPDDARSRPAVRSGTLWLGRLLVLSASVVLVTGTVVTGSGPHSGDAGSHAKLKATRLDFTVPEVARIHGTSVMVFLALTLVTLWVVSRDPGARRVMQRVGLLLILLVAQAALGYTQYFNGVPPLLVGFHVAGATAVFSATLAVLLSMYEPVPRRPGISEAGRVAEPDTVLPIRAPSPADVAGAALPPQ